MEKPEKSLTIKLTRTKFSELVETLSKSADNAKLQYAKADGLYQQFDFVIIDNEDRFFGIKGEERTFLFQGKGAWQQVVENNL